MFTWGEVFRRISKLMRHSKILRDIEMDNNFEFKINNGYTEDDVLNDFVIEYTILQNLIDENRELSDLIFDMEAGV